MDDDSATLLDVGNMFGFQAYGTALQGDIPPVGLTRWDDKMGGKAFRTSRDCDSFCMGLTLFYSARVEVKNGISFVI